ncbi:hypothetical protein CJ307_35675, partial [Klebsiella quasipneumoniae]
PGSISSLGIGVATLVSLIAIGAIGAWSQAWSPWRWSAWQHLQPRHRGRHPGIADCHWRHRRVVAGVVTL